MLNVDPLPAAAVEEQPAKEEEPTLQGLEISNQEFKSFFDDYLEGLDKEMRESFTDAELCFKQMQNGYEAHYLALKNA